MKTAAAALIVLLIASTSCASHTEEPQARDFGTHVNAVIDTLPSDGVGLSRKIAECVARQGYEVRTKGFLVGSRVIAVQEEGAVVAGIKAWSPERGVTTGIPMRPDSNTGFATGMAQQTIVRAYPTLISPNRVELVVTSCVYTCPVSGGRWSLSESSPEPAQRLSALIRRAVTSRHRA